MGENGGSILQSQVAGLNEGKILAPALSMMPSGQSRCTLFHEWHDRLVVHPTHDDGVKLASRQRDVRKFSEVDIDFGAYTLNTFKAKDYNARSLKATGAVERTKPNLLVWRVVPTIVVLCVI